MSNSNSLASSEKGREREGRKKRSDFDIGAGGHISTVIVSRSCLRTWTVWERLNRFRDKKKEKLLCSCNKNTK